MTEAGAACNMAVTACIMQDMAGARVDVASAISAARALGVEAPEAAALVMAAAMGFSQGAAERPTAGGAEEAPPED